MWCCTEHCGWWWDVPLHLHRQRLHPRVSCSADRHGQLVALHPHRVLVLHSEPGCLPHSVTHGQCCQVRHNTSNYFWTWFTPCGASTVLDSNCKKRQRYCHVLFHVLGAPNTGSNSPISGNKSYKGMLNMQQNIHAAKYFMHMKANFYNQTLQTNSQRRTKEKINSNSDMHTWCPVFSVLSW